MKPTGPARSGRPDDRLHAIRGPINELESRSRISFHFIRATKRKGNKRRRNAGRRISNDPHRRMRRALKASALACRRSTAALAAANERRSSAPATRFLGPGRSARSRWFERSCAAQRALPAPSCPSPAGCPADRSSCRPGVYPRSRPGAAVTSRRPREPLSLRQPASPACVLYGSEIRYGAYPQLTANTICGTDSPTLRLH